MKRYKMALTTGVLTASLAAIGALTSSSGAAPTAATASTAVNCRTSATVGYFGPTTGPAASIGEEKRVWVRFAISDWNADPRHKVKFKTVEGDTRLDPAETSTIAQQFASNPAILGVIGPASTGEVLAASPIFARSGMAYTNSATRTDLTNGANPGFFRLAPRDADQAVTTVNFMTKRLGVKKVEIFDDQGSYSVPLSNAVESLLKGNGVTVVRASVSQKQVDFSSVVTTIPNDVDVVYTPFTVAANMELFADQMREQGKTMKVYAGDAGFQKDYHFEGAYFSTYAPDIRTIAADKPLLTRFFKKYGSNAPLTISGPPGYVATQAMLGAISRACADGTATREEVRRQMAQTDLHRSLLGIRVRFTSSGDLVDAHFYMFQIKSGHPIVIKN